MLNTLARMRRKSRAYSVDDDAISSTNSAEIEQCQAAVASEVSAAFLRSPMQEGAPSTSSTDQRNSKKLSLNNPVISSDELQQRMEATHENGSKIFTSKRPAPPPPLAPAAALCLPQHGNSASGGIMQQQPGRCRKAAAAAAAAVCPRKGSSSLDQQSGGSGCSSSWASASSGSRPQPPSLNANSCQQHSPATSPGGSSTHSRHSFHFHHLSSSVANLRKSGVNLVKNLPNNIRRSSLAMFQMRAMGPAGSTGLADEEASCGSRTAAAGGRQHRLSADSGASQAETLSLYRQRGLPSLSEGRKRCSNAGTAAKRAMRKRISAAKLALRKISRLSSNSCGSAGAVLPASSCSTSISSPKTMHSPFSSLAATNFSAANSLTGASCSSELEQHPLRKCVSSQRLPAPPADATTESRLGMAATMATTTTTAFPPSKDQFGSNENRCWLNKSGGGGGAEDGKEPKKKRSWAATFVMPGCRTKAQPRAAEQQQQQGREAGQQRRPMLEAGLDCQQRVGTKGAASGRKQPLRPSLSWDPQQQQQKQRSRTSSAASQTSRSRIHSDGSANRQPIGPFPPLLSKYNIAEFHSQPLGICEEQQNKEKLRQFEKRTQQQQQQQKKISGLGKRRKKSSSQSALALCKGSRSNSLSTVGPAELDTAADNQQKSALELNCLHCALQAEYRSTNLRAEIECAVKRLAARLSNSGSPARTRRTLALGEQRQEKERRAREEAATTERQMELLRRQMGTPDIVVSSCNSEDTLAESADEGFWTNSTPSHTTTNNHRPGGDSGKRSACCSSVATSPVAAMASSGIGTGTRLMNDEQQQQTQRHGGNGGIADHLSMMAQVPPAIAPPMDTLKPPGFPFGLLSSSSSNNSSSLGSPGDYSGGGGSSPPRSNSVDLSQLRRDIELWSVSSTEAGGHGAIGDEERPGTAGISTPGGDSIRTVRSRSYDPSSSPEHMLRRPSRIEHLSDIFRKALAKSPVVKRAAIQQEQEHNRVSKHRTSRYWLEENLCPSEHIWLPSSSASSAVDTECYLGEKDCEKLGEKRRCAACHIVAHTACFPLLAKMNLNCKSTFRDCASSAASRRQQSKEAQDSLQKHHWVHRWRLEGRCFHCGKSFQQKMFREKEVIAITCSWCKRSYHNKRCCFSLARFDDHCDRGALREMILPPSWLLRLGNQRRHRQPQQQPSPQRQQQQQQQLAQQQRRNGSFSCKEQDKEQQQQQPVAVRKTRRKYRPFIVKPQLQDQQQQMNGAAAASQPIPMLNGISSSPTNFAPIQPLLVFVNPKSGGNKGAKVLNTLTWLLNPRQVFDITAMRGPKYGLEMFRKMATHQLRILVCGGDGTVGWVLSSLDLLNWPAYPAICLLPTGTGNDLSRSMGWGGTFSDEPLAEVLQAVQTETSVTYLDRWRLNVFPLPCSDQQQPSPVNSPTNFGASNEQPQKQQQQEVDQQQQQPPTPTFGGAEPTTAFQTTLPLAVMNNYFSIGADAHVALQFHHSRSANPQMLNSRLKNRIAYGGLGTIDLFKRTWKDLSDHIRVECDGVDISPKIRDFKFHCLLFHNIGFYAGGTIPWGQGGDGVQESCGEVFSRPSPCDGKIEVLGFTTATLAALQMGGKGERIAQCSKVRIETLKPIPMQVDGEPCLLGPSLIHLSFHNKVPMLRREKFARMSGSAPANNIVSMNANRRKSSNNSTQTGGANSSGGGSPSITQHHHNHQTTATGTMATAPPPASQHKSSRTSLYADTFVRPTAASPPNSVFMCVPVVVVGRHDYDTYRDTVDRLKDTGFELGTLNVEAEMELGQVRQLIQQLLAQHQILPYEPGREWRFLDYVSNSEEGTFRISRQQEQSRTVADVCSLDEGAGILILDDAFPSMTVRSAAIGHELVFSPAHGAKPISALDQNMLMRRRISETLRIVLSSESQETHL